jgi:hypothetical protein
MITKIGYYETMRLAFFFGNFDFSSRRGHTLTDTMIYS